MLSPAQYLASLSEEERANLLLSLDPKVKAQLKYHWPFWARPDQLEPEGTWTTWLLLAGRGFGKSRCGAEWVRKKAFEHPGCRIALVGETAADTRKVMVEGESGILAISSPDFMPVYSPANRTLTWPNGSMAETYNATQPDQLRGPQHHYAWCDEIAKWQYMQDSWDQLQFGLRLGHHPQQVVTTTPRPLPLVKKLINDPDTIVTRGRTYDNAANLAGPFLKQIEERYGGTRLGRQELEGEVLEDIPGALWTRESIDINRRPEAPMEMQRIIVAVDPATSSDEGSDETGIVCVGIAKDADGYSRGYVLADRSLRGSPDEWAKAAIATYREFEADRIVAEKNQGGEMVEAVIKAVDRNAPVSLVHASRGKVIRAEPISALYEQNRVHHVGRFDELEDQMCMFSADYDRANGSPDRIDALVWGLSFLFDKMTGRRRPHQKEEDKYKVETTTYKENNVYRGKTDTAWMGM
jgi:phage terminase large subunit-like protein